MRFYTQPHPFYCGVDLHARTLSLCILDADGNRTRERTFNPSPQAFLEHVAPFRDGLVVGCECTCTWYWLADRCHREGIPFVLGHALYVKAIHGGKAMNDPLDAYKIAALLRGGMFPIAYVYPKGMRETRDLLRRRMFLVHQRAGVVAHVQNTNSQYNLPPFAKKLVYAANREELNVLERFTDPSVHKSISLDLSMIDHYDCLINDVELYLTRSAKVDDPQAYHRLQSIPGVGKILALVLLYEIHDIGRFASAGQFLSYARLVRCDHESAGKKQGPLTLPSPPGGEGRVRGIGNAHLRWAFAEAACLFLRASPRAKLWKQRQERKRGAGRALGILAAKLGRTVYHLLRKEVVFDEERFWGTRGRCKSTR